MDVRRSNKDEEWKGMGGVWEITEGESHQLPPESRRLSDSTKEMKTFVRKVLAEIELIQRYLNIAAQGNRFGVGK